MSHQEIHLKQPIIERMDVHQKIELLTLRVMKASVKSLREQLRDLQQDREFLENNHYAGIEIELTEKIELAQRKIDTLENRLWQQING